MDGQQESPYRSPNAEGAALKYGATFDKEIDWFTQAFDAVHSELKDDRSPLKVPHSINFPNHAQLSLQQKDKLMNVYMTACTMKTKAKAYNANRTKGNDSQTEGNSDRDVEMKNLTEFVWAIHKTMEEEVDKWPNNVPYPQDVSSLHTVYYEAIKGVYMKAKTVALNRKWTVETQEQLRKMKQEKDDKSEKENPNQAAQIIQLNDLLKQPDNELKEVKQRNSERMSTMVNENTNQAANTIDLDELLKQLHNELKEVKQSEGMSAKIRAIGELLKQTKHELKEVNQRDSRGMSTWEKENPNNAAKMRQWEEFLKQNEYEFSDVIQRDSKEMSAKMRELEERLKQREQELREVKHRDSEGGMSDKKIRELEELLKQREHELRELKQRDSKEMSAKIRELEERLKQREQELREVKHRDSEGMSDKKIRELDERLKQREHELRELKQRTGEDDSASASENRNHARKISKLQEILRERENELQEVKLRLSALMGAKLQDGNVNITDLSDTNRPTKIAERFGQLYDDCWTDAFQIMTGNFGRSDEEAIARLLEMLKDAHQFCKKTSQEHTNGVLCELLLCKKSNTQRESEQKPQIKDLNEVQRKQFHELRRQTANCTTENLTNMYFGYATKARTFTEHEISLCTQYLELSVELCWYMIIQNPPVHIQFEPPMRDKPFKTGEYKFYSRSGKTFDYIVWPPLRLTEGGDLLAKGVAEPMR